MKKLFVLVLALTLAFTLLTACGGKGNGNSGNNDFTATSENKSDTNLTGLSESEKQATIDFTAIFEGTSDIKLTGLSESEKQAIIDAGKAAGVEVLFSTVNDDVFFTRLSDGYHAAWALGSWDFWSESDIKPAQWPDDEFTRQIPKPDFNLTLADTSGNKFTAIFKGVTLEQIKAYTESVKAAGFTLTPELNEATTYKYKASNGNGYSIELTRYTGDDQTVYVWITKE